MTDVREATASLLADKPELEDDVRALLELDADGAWSFDDAPLDSGAFGEIVSRGIVEERETGYRIADREAVAAALDGEDAGEPDDEDAGAARPSLSGFVPSVDRRPALFLGAALLAVAVVRLSGIPGVFRSGDVVLTGNDPYGYLYWVEELFRTRTAFDPAALGELPSGGYAQDTLTVVVLWWVTALFGGADSAGAVLALYPVVVGVLTALVVYLLGVRLSDDRRVGLAAVLLLAITPAHAFRTMVGFADHHAFDYLWLSVTALGLAVLATERAGVARRRFTLDRGGWLAVLAVGVGAAGSVHAWRAGPLMLLPIAGYLVVRVLADVRDRVSPLATTAPTLAGLALAAGLTLVPFVLFGWASVFRAFSPLLLFGGGLGVVALGTVAVRLDRSARETAGVGAALGALGFGTVFLLVAPFRHAVFQGVGYFARTSQSGIAETHSIFSGQFGSLFGPVLLFGFALFLAVPYLGWVTLRAWRENRPAWLLTCVYTWYFFVLAIVQNRFAGQLALFVAVFAGIGLVHLAATIEVAGPLALFADAAESASAGRTIRTPSIPDRRALLSLSVLFLLVASWGLVQTPIKQSQLLVEDNTYDAATWLEGYAAEQDLSYPENYVFSRWGRNRVYNYFVNGQSATYSYAQRNFGSFIQSTSPGTWYERLRGDGRAGFVVLGPVKPDSIPARSIQSRLYRYGWGGREDGVAGVEHYRAVYANDRLKVYDVVPGATIVGTAPPNGTTTVSVPVSVPGGSFTYDRQVRATGEGTVALTVPYPGTYAVGGREISVSEADVLAGEFVVDDRFRGDGAPGEIARWTFDAGLGSVAVDRVGDAHARALGDPAVVPGVNGSAIGFDGQNDRLSVSESRAPEIENGSFTFTFWMRGDLGSSSTRYPTVFDNIGDSGYGLWARNDVGDFGVRMVDTDGDVVRNFGIQSTEFTHWTHIGIVLDREQEELRLYRNGSLVQTTSTASLDRIANNGPMFVGGRGGAQHAPIRLDGVRFYNRSLDVTPSMNISGPWAN